MALRRSSTVLTELGLAPARRPAVRPARSLSSSSLIAPSGARLQFVLQAELQAELGARSLSSSSLIALSGAPSGAPSSSLIAPSGAPSSSLIAPSGAPSGAPIGAAPSSSLFAVRPVQSLSSSKQFVDCSKRSSKRSSELGLAPARSLSSSSLIAPSGAVAAMLVSWTLLSHSICGRPPPL